MSQPNPSTAMATALIDELCRCGVTRFVLSPGSRSAALAIAAADHPGIETVMVLDERSAAFYALGLAKAATRPTALISTSGTAPANYLPAIVEADASITPLVVLSADRPNELRGVGANQTIDQVELYGNRVRAFYDLAAPEPTVDGNDQWRSIAGQAVAMSLGLDGSPGPVHPTKAQDIDLRLPLQDEAKNHKTETQASH